GESTEAEDDALGMQGDTWQTSSILNGIRDYNIDDCDSTQELVEWLRARQVENGIEPLQSAVTEEQIPTEEQTELTNLRDGLLRIAADNEQSETVGDRNIGQLARNLAGFLEFHRREDKPAWWRLFDRMACTPKELLDDPGALACCTRTEREPFLPSPRARNKAYEYRFDTEQAYKGIGRRPNLHGGLNDKGYPVSVTLVDPGQTIPCGEIVMQSKNEPSAEITLVADEIVPSRPIPGAIASVVSAMNLTTLEPSAITDFLSRSKPRIKGHDRGVIATGATSEERLASTVAAVLNLDNSYLTIQGPPGTGKSYTGARIIAALCAQGKRVGISSNSHSAINNLLIKAAEHCLEIGVDATFICGKKTADIPSHLNIEESANAKLADKCVPGVVVGTTAWGFSRDDLAGQFDVLLVDEAGQVATANLVAMSRSASNLVLLGDQMQLGQPVQGTHPADSGQSVLDYLLQDTPTVPADQGVFLETCYRMHPLINEFISSRIYEGKLKADKGTAARTIVKKAGTDPLIDLAAGITFVPVIHSGNTQDSVEEVDEIKRLADQLIGRVRTDSDGNEHTIQMADMLFVAPYNMQVRRLEECLGSDARVGSVDKFQGQEAAIVFISLCTSDAADSPRGIDFLFDRNRLNVAVSRAQTLVVVVGHPDLATTRVGSLEQLKKVNLLAALLASGAV
ncbi:MAG: AAA domain-containing protein, partial [Granulosicoccus sp.]